MNSLRVCPQQRGFRRTQPETGTVSTSRPLKNVFHACNWRTFEQPRTINQRLAKHVMRKLGSKNRFSTAC